MKIIYLIVFTLFVFGCKDGMVNFNIDFTKTTTINSSLPVNIPFDVMTPETTTNTEQELEIRDSRKNLVEEVFLEELTIEITSPENQDFNFLKEIEIFINSPNNDEEKVASKTDIPSGKTKLNLEAFDINLTDYLIEDEFSLRIKTITNQVITQNIDLETYTDFNISAKII